MNKRGRPKVTIEYPENFPLLMFDIIDRQTNTTIRKLAKNPRQAKYKAKFRYASAKPTAPSTLINEHGHHGASVILRSFGEEWVSKDGRIFYHGE